jgi:hypothetical protein
MAQWNSCGLADDWLPKPHILHPWPQLRFADRHSSRMRESRLYGSVRGAVSNDRPYREHRWTSRPSGVVA